MLRFWDPANAHLSSRAPFFLHRSFIRRLCRFAQLLVIPGCGLCLERFNKGTVAEKKWFYDCFIVIHWLIHCFMIHWLIKFIVINCIQLSWIRFCSFCYCHQEWTASDNSRKVAVPKSCIAGYAHTPCQDMLELLEVAMPWSCWDDLARSTLESLSVCQPSTSMVTHWRLGASEQCLMDDITTHWLSNDSNHDIIFVLIMVN